jgi:hypothetical protein
VRGKIERNQKSGKKIRRRSEAEAVFHSVRRQNDYQGYRSGAQDNAGPSLSGPILIGAAMIATALLLSALITTLGTRYIGLENSAEDSAWLIDRLTGSVYKCQVPGRGKAPCDPEIATGSIRERPK